MDMSRQFPMNRMLQGDVGSGKTVVAVYAMMLAVAKGHQAVMMAPTEVLARQHHETLRNMLAESRVRIGLLCGSLTSEQRREVIRAAADGELDLLVGTQALLYGNIEFKKLGLCVIDEQHKFGVKQRVTLRGGGVDPHYLVMSATPIPRSMAMTVFGDVDLSTLRDQPPGRGSVNTLFGPRRLERPLVGIRAATTWRRATGVCGSPADRDRVGFRFRGNGGHFIGRGRFRGSVQWPVV